MLKALLAVARSFVTVPVLEFAGIVLVTVAVWGGAGIWYGLGTLGGLLFLKALDLSIPKVP